MNRSENPSTVVQYISEMIEIVPKLNLCEFQEVSVLRPLDTDQKNNTLQEIREHLTEMMQAGTIKHSLSSYSSKIVIVGKKIGPSDFVFILGN